MYYTFKIAALLIRPINGGTDRYTVSDLQMTFTKEWHPDDPETQMRIGAIIANSFEPLAEDGDLVQASLINIKLAEAFA